VITGGIFNGERSVISGPNIVTTGGTFNVAQGTSSVVVGGVNNEAIGDYSIAFGTRSRVKNANSMLINCADSGKFEESTEDGQFKVIAESFLFQIGDGKQRNGEVRKTQFTSQNIKRLSDLLDSEEEE